MWRWRVLCHLAIKSQWLPHELVICFAYFLPCKMGVRMLRGINDRITTSMTAWGNIKWVQISLAARQDQLLRITTDPDVMEDIMNHPVRISFVAFEHSSLFVNPYVPATDVQSSVIAASIHGYILSHKDLSSMTNPSSLRQVQMMFRTNQVKCGITGALM